MYACVCPVCVRVCAPARACVRVCVCVCVCVCARVNARTRTHSCNTRGKIKGNNEEDAGVDADIKKINETSPDSLGGTRYTPSLYPQTSFD